MPKRIDSLAPIRTCLVEYSQAFESFSDKNDEYLKNQGRESYHEWIAGKTTLKESWKALKKAMRTANHRGHL